MQKTAMTWAVNCWVKRPLPQKFLFNAGKTEKFDITEDTAITIAENAEKMFDKIREVLANKNMNNDVKIDVIRLLIKG